jgi:hypothetical protein
MNCNPTTDNKGAWVNTRGGSAGTSDLVTTALSFIGYTNTQLSYDYAMLGYDGSGTNDKFDNLTVSVSACNGAYSPVYSYTPSTMTNTNGITDPTNAQCQSNTVNLSAYDGLSGVKIKFSITDNDGNNFYIDNINITGTTVVTPVTLMSFEGSIEREGFVNLQWVTASEVNIIGYKIYKTNDVQAGSWQEIAFVRSANSMNLQTYYYEDEDDFSSEILYYKLVPIENGGITGPAKVIAVRSPENSLCLNAYPNPSFHAFNVMIKGNKEKASLTVSDMLGRAIEEIKVPAGVSKLTIGEHLAPGAYYLTIRNSTGNETIKLLRN